MNIKTYKEELRREKIRTRNALTEDQRSVYSAEICRRIADTPEYAAAETILLYKWVKGEVRLDELERIASADGKCLVYPLCITKTEMLGVEPGSGSDAWNMNGYMGIMEPVAEHGRVVEASEIDLVICPCTSFDEQCRRLGMGGGFYDRYLPGCINAAKMAVAFEIQRADEIPKDEYDITVDAVISEKGIIRRKP